MCLYLYNEVLFTQFHAFPEVVARDTDPHQLRIHGLEQEIFMKCPVQFNFVDEGR